jgi:hypothetical protein
MKRVILLFLLVCVGLASFAQTPPTQATDSSQSAKVPAETVVATPAPSAKPAAMPDRSTTHLFRGAKIFIAPIEGGYDIYLTAAIQKKQVPVVVVMDRSKADFEIAGVTDTEKAGWAKMFFIGTDHSNEQASIKIADLKSGDIVYGYNVNKHNSVRGKQSSSEACAKHIKEEIEKHQ